MRNVLFVSLGCDKNLVDSEKMLGLLNEAGYRVAQEESEADAIVVNTCCFIHDAKEESVETILEMAEWKKKGRLKALIVTETSDIRKWLNNEFYTTAFNKTEKAKIQTSLIKNEDNSEYGTSGGNDTEDKVFLLSEKEAETLFSNDEEKIAKATEYAEKSVVYGNEEKAVLWWLRSPGGYSENAAVVDRYGWVDRYGFIVNINDGGVRPALYLNLQS
mgnify:CR=1 FL=1